jgi:hypothetical protein
VIVQPQVVLRGKSKDKHELDAGSGNRLPIKPGNARRFPGKFAVPTITFGMLYCFFIIQS